MKGSELMAARKALGWSRQDLADRAGLSVYRITMFEQGKQFPNTEELNKLGELLMAKFAETLVATGEHPVIRDVPADVQSATWNGLRRGDEVKVDGEPGRFKFLFHHKDETQEYVQVFGPIPGSVPRSRKPKASHQRSIRPERVITL